MARFAANLTMMFTELPFMERFGAAARAGFRAVEYMLPYAHEASAIRAELDAHGLEQALFNTPPGDWEKGARGAAAIDGEGALFPAHLAQALDYAAVIRPKNIHVMAGVGEGDDDIFEDNLRVACAAAPEQGFVIEPINTRDMPGYYLHSTAHAARMIERVGAPNLGLQLDLYHCQIMEGDLTRRIEALAPLIAHVQIAGVPERHEPDAGEFSLPHLLRTLERVGYDGFIGCEYRPAGRTEDGLGWFAPYRN